MSDLDTQEELEFQFDKWLGKDKEESGGHIGCEMPVVREGQEPLTGKTSGLLQWNVFFGFFYLILHEELDKGDFSLIWLIWIKIVQQQIFGPRE